MLKKIERKLKLISFGIGGSISLNFCMLTETQGNQIVTERFLVRYGHECYGSINFLGS